MSWSEPGDVCSPIIGIIALRKAACLPVCKCPNVQSVVRMVWGGSTYIERCLEYGGIRFFADLFEKTLRAVRVAAISEAAQCRGTPARKNDFVRKPGGSRTRITILLNEAQAVQDSSMRLESEGKGGPPFQTFLR